MLLSSKCGRTPPPADLAGDQTRRRGGRETADEPSQVAARRVLVGWPTSRLVLAMEQVGLVTCRFVLVKEELVQATPQVAEAKGLVAPALARRGLRGSGALLRAQKGVRSAAARSKEAMAPRSTASIGISATGGGGPAPPIETQALPRQPAAPRGIQPIPTPKIKPRERRPRTSRDKLGRRGISRFS